MDNTLSHKSVLIIADDELLLQSLKHMVRDFGVTNLSTACDGGDALGRLGAKPVDLVIADVGLKDEDGLAFARRLRHGEGGADPSTAIILLASEAEQARIEAVRDIGVDGLVEKPISASPLYSLMLSVAARPREFVDCAGYKGPDRRETPRGIAGPARADHDSDAVIDWAKVQSVMATPPKSTEAPFIRSVHNDIKAIIRVLDETGRDPARQPQSVRSIGSIAGFIKEQGRKENYPLMSSIAESLQKICRAEGVTGREQLDVVKSHIAAMAALISDKIGGNDRAMGSAILDLLRDTARHQNIHPRPVVWPRRTA